MTNVIQVVAQLTVTRWLLVRHGAAPVLAVRAVVGILACIGMAGAAMGVGNVAGNYLAGALRNPSAAASQTATLFIGMAFAEALGIFSFLVALLLLFAA